MYIRTSQPVDAVWMQSGWTCILNSGIVSVASVVANLVGGLISSEKYERQLGCRMIIPNIWEKKNDVPNHQPVMVSKVSLHCRNHHEVAVGGPLVLSPPRSTVANVISIYGIPGVVSNSQDVTISTWRIIPRIITGEDLGLVHPLINRITLLRRLTITRITKLDDPPSKIPCYTSKSRQFLVL